ncbi:MAG TPA: VOC family protein [Candidatus Acidoferrales bacterium]|jgi:predicted 3-demethylubiquinone-9 3-methyltransferase (glyoxalase superfamily)|nr:VOC family protein [Candidatus Acidoferrales bacterium]
MQKVRPFLWFDGRAVEAARFYLSVFKDSEAVNPESVADAGDAALTSVTIRVGGQELILFNGGPLYTFSAATSFLVECESQEEVDYFWERLSEGSDDTGNCGWIKDKFGVTWQIVPAVLFDLLQQDETKRNAVVKVMYPMTKLDIAALQKASDDA